MVRKRVLVVSLMAMVSAGSASAASVTTSAVADSPKVGIARNQAALGFAGHVTPAMRVMAQRCAGSNCSTNAFASGGGGLVVGAFAAGAVGFGAYEATRHHHHNNDVTPVSS